MKRLPVKELFMMKKSVILISTLVIIMITLPVLSAPILISQYKPVTASSTYSTSYPSNLTNGSYSTGWNSGTSSVSWAQIDLQEELTIVKAIWYANVLPNGNQTFNLYIDSILVDSITQYVEFMTPVTFELATPIEGRYVKMELSGVSWKSGMEFEIYGPEPEPDPQPIPEPLSIILLLISASASFLKKQFLG
ncbi:MAG: discoidin domain-containing protein [Candidatus Auribacterota bacterium]